MLPLALYFYSGARDAGLGPHLGLLVATALSTTGEMAVTGWSERFGVHMGLRSQGPNSTKSGPKIGRSCLGFLGQYFIFLGRPGPKIKTLGRKS